MNVGIIGAGHIAEKAAWTLKVMDDMQCLAVGSRSLEKAQAFADKYGIPRAYGSYADLLADPDVDLVYIATPHSHHFAVTRDAILAGKACLVEKSFMANTREAAEILSLGKEKGVLVAEAIWTRYLPVQDMAREMIASGLIGKPYLYSATLSYEISTKERVLKPELCGGALLDLGVYGLNFIRMFCASPVVATSSHCVKFPTGVDASETITLEMEDGSMACIQTSALCQGENTGSISGTAGCLVFDDVNSPRRLSVYQKGHVLVKESEAPGQITGFEYQFRACRDAMAAGLLETPQMPHSEILYIMEQMDRLRASWGVRFPMD